MGRACVNDLSSVLSGLLLFWDFVRLWVFWTRYGVSLNHDLMTANR